MEFRLLGPLSALDGDRSLDLGRGRQRALFAVLLLHANEVVSTDLLIDELWGDAPPRTALKSVQVYVSRLRKELGDGRLVTEPPGYSLRVERSELDLARFEQLVAEAGGADPQGSAEMLRSALDLWRGPPLADLAYESFAQPEIARLEELRWAATERRIEADLACGRHAELVGELQSLIAEHPLRERLRAQLMLALYRSGRQADALSAYRAAQRELSEQLGLEPSEELKSLEQAILSHDASLDRPTPVTAAPTPVTAAMPRDLPVQPARTPAASRLSPRRLVAAAGALILAAAAAAGVVELTEGGGSAEALAEVSPDSLAVLDPTSNRIVGAVSIPGQPSLVAASGRSIWVGSDTSRTISRIDPRTLAIRAVVPTNTLPHDLDAAGDSVWLLDRERPALVKVDATYHSVARRLPLPASRRLNEPFGAGVDAGRRVVWVADGTSGLLRLDPDLVGAVKRFDLGQPVDDVVSRGGTVWAISARSASVLELDPSSGEVTRIPITGRPGSTRPVPIALAADERGVWVLNANTPSVTHIDPELKAVRATIPLGVGSNPTSIATGAGAVWVAVGGEGAVLRIDSRTGALRSIPVGGAPTGVAVSRGKVWISVQPSFRAALASRSRTSHVPGALSESFCSRVEFGGRGRPDLVIASDFTLQHGSGPFPALQYSDAVRFVLARQQFRAGGYRVGYQSCDDSSVRKIPYSYTPATCRRNARAYARAPAVVGVVGPFDSPCAAVQIPVLNRAEGGPLAEISGSTTQVGLTHRGPGAGPGEPERFYPTGVRSFARVVAADDVQGAADAVMAKRIGVDRLFILEDNEPYGQGVASAVRRAATELGLELAGSAHWDYRDRRFTRLARTIRRTGANGVFLGGIYTARGPRLLKDLRAVLGAEVKILAPDGFADFTALTQEVGPAAEGLVVSVPAVPAERLAPSGRRFVEDFEEGIGGRASPHAITAAQATQVLLDAIAASDGTRASVARNLFRVRVNDGILGDFEIDENGDTTAAGVTMYRIERGRERVFRVITPPASLVGSSAG